MRAESGDAVHRAVPVAPWCVEDGRIANPNTDPAMGWLDPDEVPTLGDWFRAGGYQTLLRGKWHISHANLEIPVVMKA